MRVDEGGNSVGAVSLGPKLIASGGFEALYREGMGLIEEVAAYLDGPGRDDSRHLAREASLVYASESMRLTTRLMQLASWLLLQRAVNEGEITADNARAEKEKVRFSATPSTRGGPGWEALPAELVAFIAKGDRLFERVVRFDTMDRGRLPPPASVGVNDIADQLSRLKAAFGGVPGE